MLDRLFGLARGRLREPGRGAAPSRSLPRLRRAQARRLPTCFVDWALGVAGDPEVLRAGRHAARPRSGSPTWSSPPPAGTAPAPGPYDGLRGVLLDRWDDVRAHGAARGPPRPTRSAGAPRCCRCSRRCPGRWRCWRSARPRGCASTRTATPTATPAAPGTSPSTRPTGRARWCSTARSTATRRCRPAAGGGVARRCRPQPARRPRRRRDARGWRPWSGPSTRTGGRRLAAAVGAGPRRTRRTLVRGDLTRRRCRRWSSTCPTDATLVVFHSAVLAYLAEGDRDRFTESMAALPGHWVSNEGPRVVPGVTATAAPRPTRRTWSARRRSCSASTAGPWRGPRATGAGLSWIRLGPMTEQPAHPEQPQVPETRLPGHVDVLIVGAGLSGIGAACHLEDAAARARRTPCSRRRERDRRHLGPVPLPRRALRLRHVHPRLPVPAVDRRQGDRRRPRDPATTCARPRGSTASSEQIRYGQRVERGGVVDRGRHLDGARSSRGRRAGRADLRLPVVVQRLLPLRRGLPAGVPGRRATSTRRHGRAPAALARGPRLRRQAGRRDRQRRDRGDAGAGDGRASAART